MHEFLSNQRICFLNRDNMELDVILEPDVLCWEEDFTYR